MGEKLRTKKYSSICITTYYDKTFEKLGNIALKSMEKYGKKFKIDVIRYERKLSNRPPAWNKILVVKELLKKYDFVIWMDSDAVFVRFDVDIRKEIKKGKDFYISLIEFNGKVVPNSGFFITRRSKWSIDFLNRVWNKKEYIYHNYWENAAIIDLLGYESVLSRNKYKVLINNFLHKTGTKVFFVNFLNALRLSRFIYKLLDGFEAKQKETVSKSKHSMKKVKWLNRKWNSLPGKAKVPNAIVNHYPARSYEERLKKMSEDLEKAGIKQYK